MIVQTQGTYVITKPGVPHMVFNLGHSVAEATNFFLEGHQRLITNIYKENKLVYKFLICMCKEGARKKQKLQIARILRSSFNSTNLLTYANRVDKLTHGRKKRSGAKKKKNSKFTRVKVTQ